MAAAADSMNSCGIIATKLSDQQISGYERLAELRIFFEAGRKALKAGLAVRVRQPALYGDWALLSVSKLAARLPGLLKQKGLPAECLGRLSRDIFGRWSALHLYTVRGLGELYRLGLRDSEAPAPLTLFMPRWTDFVEYGQLILCNDTPMAKAVEQGVRSWWNREHLPVATVDRCIGVLDEPVTPFTCVWATVHGDRTARFALPFCGAGDASNQTEVRVRRLPEDVIHRDEPAGILMERSLFCGVTTAPDCISDLAAMIAAEKGHQPISTALADLLEQIGWRASSRCRLIDEVGKLADLRRNELIDERFDAWPDGPYALNTIDETTWIARDGRYWRRGRKEKEFTAVTNFRVRFVLSRVNDKGKMIHEVCLEIGEKKMDVRISSAVLDSPKRLLTALTNAATLAGADFPIIPDPKAKRLLPELIKATVAPATPTIP